MTYPFEEKARPGRWNALEIILDELDSVRYADLPQVLRGMAAITSYRKSSKILFTHLMLDVLQAEDPRSLILTACLYFEHIFIRRCLSKAMGNRRPLAIEIRNLYSEGEIDESMRDNMLAIVDLRNNFAHELYFDIADWDPATTPFFADRALRIPKPRHLRAQKHLALAKLLLMYITKGLLENLPWLIHEDVPENQRRRSNTYETSRRNRR